MVTAATRSTAPGTASFRLNAAAVATQRSSATNPMARSGSSSGSSMLQCSGR